MEPLRQTSSIVTNAYLTLYRILQEIEVEVIQFTNLPVGTPSLDVLAEDIAKKFAFSRNLLTTEIKSYGSRPEDMVEVEERLEELETEFNRSSNMLPLDHDVMHDIDNNEDDFSSVCESCLNYNGELQRIESDVSSGYDQVLPEILHEVMVPPQLPEVFHESIMPPSSPEMVEEITMPHDCRPEKTGGSKKRRRRWWLRRMVVVLAVSAVLMVSVSSYFDNKQYQGFLTPT